MQIVINLVLEASYAFQFKNLTNYRDRQILHSEIRLLNFFPLDKSYIGPHLQVEDVQLYSLFTVMSYTAHDITIQLHIASYTVPNGVMLGSLRRTSGIVSLIFLILYYLNALQHTQLQQ